MCFFCAVASAQRWCFIRWERCPLCLWHHGWSGQESLGWPWSGGDRRAVPVRSSSNTHLRSRRTTAYVHHDNNIFIHIVYVWECNGFFLFYNQSHHHWLHPQAVLFKSYCLSPPQGTDFHPKYTGENLTCTVQGLKRSTQYKFRVSCGTIQMFFYSDLNTLSFYFKPRFSSDYCTTSELFFLHESADTYKRWS